MRAGRGWGPAEAVGVGQLPEGQADEHQRKAGDDKPKEGEGLCVAAVYAVENAAVTDTPQRFAHGEQGEGVVQHAGGDEGEGEDFQHGNLRQVRRGFMV